MAHYRDMRFSVYKGIEQSRHRHPEVELLYVVDGHIRVEYEERTVVLGEYDVLLLDSGVSHCAVGEDALLCLVKYPWQLVNEKLGDGGRFLRCSSAEDTVRSYVELRDIFRELVFQYAHSERHSDCLVDSLLLRLLDELIEHFRWEAGEEDRAVRDGEQRLQQIIQFVNQSYQHNLSLSKMAVDLQVSTSTLSRFFKKRMGCYFVDYVNQIRVQAAMRELEETEENITKIAVNNGFSNMSVFNRTFRDLNGVTPAEYRRRKREGREQQEQMRRQAAQELREHLRRRSGQIPAAVREQLRLSAGAGERWRKPWVRAVNIGSAFQLAQTNLQSHLLLLKQELGLRYVRIWNVFARELMITDGIRVGDYCFDAIDNVLDFLVDNHIRPWMDLGRRPNIITRNERELVFQEHECIDFRSRRVWEHLVRSFVRHVVKRYGRDEVGGWIFELTFIPSGDEADLLYRCDGERFDYTDAFACLHRVVREYVGQARVGGPGAAFDNEEELHREILKKCVERGCVPDFFSIMLYPYRSIERWRFTRRREQGWEERAVERAAAALEELGLKECALCVCEWNISLSNRNFLNDSCYRSAHLAHLAARIWERVYLFAACMGSDWVDNHYDNYRIVNGNMGLLGQHNVRKPIFFLLGFLKALGEFLLYHGEHLIVTRTDHGSYYILCFNYKPLGEQYYRSDEDVPLPNQLDSLLADHEPLELELTLEGLPEDTVYTVKRRSINEREGSILLEWGRFRYDERLSDSDIRYLRDACFPRLSMERIAVQGGCVCVREQLQANEVSLLHIYPHHSGYELPPRPQPDI